MQTTFNKRLLGIVVVLIVFGGGLALLLDSIIKQQSTNLPENTTLSSELQKETWSLESVNDAIVDSSIFIRFSSDTQMGGFDGCNSFGAPYALNGSTLTINEPVNSTLIFCNEQGNAGQEFINALLSANEIGINGGVLTIKTATMGDLGFTKRVISAGLVGKWDYISAMTNGEEIPVITGSNISIDFAADGTFSGEACNLFTGNYTAETVNQGSLSLSDMITTDRACADTDLQSQETEFYANINYAESFEVFDNNMLFIYTNESNYLRFARNNQ